MKYSLDNYNKMMADVMKSVTNNTDVDTDSITKVLNELGIKSSNDNEYKLVLWNDHVNDMLSVLVALFEVCKLPNEKCMEVMMEAHTKGKAVIKTGSFDELNIMKTGLNDRNLEATIEN